jgi:6-phosphogluconolactonase (cycloisomerase 2 family)
MRLWRVLPLAVILPLLGGCGKFFVPQTSSGGGGTSTGNYIYVANETTSSIAGFSVGTSALSVISGSPYSLGISPDAIAITPSGSFLYASSLGGAIYGYSIGSNGALTLLNSGNPVVSQLSPLAVKVDPTGNWLVAVDPTPAAYVFSINTSTGLLTSEGNIPLDVGTPDDIVFTPNESFVYVSLGTGGVDILSFDSGTGALSGPTGKLSPLQTVNADQGMAVDPGSKYLFVTETGQNGVRVMSIAANGALTNVSGSPYATGLGASSVLVDSTGSYVYVANRTANNISAFLLSTAGALTAISGSPFTTGINPIDMAEDTTDTHIAVACAGGSPDMQVFTIDTTTTPGALTSFGTATTGTDPTGAGAVAATK